MKDQNEKEKKSFEFVCKNCKKNVADVTSGTHHRNHCPFCLWSRHVDIMPGDRKSKCWGMMSPVGITYKKDGEEMIVHQCQKCGCVGKNRVAGDDDQKLIEKLKKEGVGDRLL